jgi:amino acid adenylation domain-containing protein/non-ribosomal peptide synthase protein (TIGR01720 family)
MDKIFTTLTDIVRYRAENQRNQKAYTFLKDGDIEEVSYTYETLDIRARAIAAWLQTKVQQGDRVMLLYHQGLDFISAFYGCLYAGVIAVPGYPPEKQHRRTTRLQAVVKDAGAKIAITTSDVIASLEMEDGKSLVGLDMEWYLTDTLSDTWAKSWSPPLIHRDTVTYLQYSSGSTGDPKGIMVSHGNMLDNSAIICDRLQHTRDDVSVSWLPIFHDLGLIGCVIQPMYVGFHAVSLSPYQYVVNPYLWLKAIDRFRGTTTCCPNFGFDLCVRKISQVQRASLDLSSWRVAVNCAEPVRHRTLEKFTEVFSPYGFRAEAHYPMYGMAETTLYIAGGRWKEKPVYQSVSITDLNNRDVRLSESEDSRVVVSCGTSGDGLTIKCVDPEKRTLCEPNRVGEIWVKGSSVAHGYWNKPEQTKEDFSAWLDGDGPYLRTGDLGYFIEDELFIAGRYKDLVIIRGRNLYPQDLELTVESCSSFLRPGCGAAFSVDIDDEEKLVIVQEIRTDAEELVDISQLARQIQQAISAEHGVSCYEIVFIKENSVQKTSSGKIQRRACKKIYLANQLQVVYRVMYEEESMNGKDELFIWEDWIILPPSKQRTQLQGKLLDLLNLQVQKEDWVKQGISFFGFDSIKILQFKFMIEEYWHVELPKVGTLLTWNWDQLIVCIHAQLLERPNEELKEDQRMKQSTEITLNRGQEAIWYIQETYPKNIAYHIPIALRFPKELNKTHLQHAIELLMEKYPSLRTSIRQRSDGKPFPYVHKDTIDVLVEKEAIVDFAEQLVEDAYAPFVLEKAPLFRAVLYKHLDESYTFLLCFHHIICDLWSMDLFLAQLRDLYMELESGKILDPLETVELMDFTTTQDLQHLEYWKEKLAGELPILNLPQKSVRGRSQSFLGEKIESELPADLLQSLNALANRYGATLYQLLLTVYQMVLAQYSGQDDILVGSPSVGRTNNIEAKQLTYMANPIVIRGDLSQSLTFVQLLQQTMQNVQEASEYEIPFIDLVEKLTPIRDASIPSIFQAMLAFEQTTLIPELSAISLGKGDVKMKWGNWDVTSKAISDPTSQFDLCLKAAPWHEGLLLHWQYDVTLFDRSLMQQLADSFVSLLEQIVMDPNLSIDSYTCMTKDAESEVIQLGDGGSSPKPTMTLNQTWREQARKTPHAIAVIDGVERVTYQKMLEDVNQLTHHLLDQGIGNGQIVGIALSRKYPLLVAIMAVLQTGAAYVGLDPAYPKDRILYMIDDADLSLLLVQSDVENMMQNSGIPTLNLTSGFWKNYPKKEIVIEQSVTDLAYLIYTSGSTGRPKGVAIEHLQAVTFVQWAKSVFSCKELAGVLFGTSICFDLSIFELFVPLLTGGKVIIGENALSLPSLPAANEVTLLNTVPSAAKGLLTLGIPSSVTTINLAGEPLSRQLTNELYELEHVNSVYNLYGPSECTTYSTFTLVDREDPSPPSIGKPITGTKVYILDSQLQLVPIGVVGELYIGGAGVARGYLGSPQKTAEKFIDHPKFGRIYRTGDLVRYSHAGVLQYLGRTDFQVKLRGYRIELGEIECALTAYASVKEAVVIEEKQQLIAYVVAKENLHDHMELKTHLEEMLPTYMIPSQFLIMDSFPLTLNGKVNRKALPIPSSTSGQKTYLPPSSQREAKLLKIWKKVLKRDEIGIKDRFFELGGDSILSLQVIAAAKSEGIQISPKHFFTHPTIEEMASILNERRKKPINQGLVTGNVPITPIQHWFFEQKIPNNNNWNQSMILSLDMSIDPLLLKQVLQKLVFLHDALRLRFYQEKDKWGAISLEEENSFFHIVDGSNVDVEELHQSTENRLDIKNGPLLSATFVNRKQENPLFILAIHHLVVDGVSWRILLDDIGNLYRQMEKGNQLTLPQKTTSYQDWSYYLQKMNHNILDEKERWLQVIDTKVEAFPVDFLNGINTDTQVEEYKQAFTRQDTETILNQSQTAKVNELLIAALWQAYQNWSGNKNLCLHVEGHGRDHQSEEMDLSRTVGWFTSIYPLTLHEDERRNALQIVKDELLHTPNGGIGYGLLRYLSKDAEIHAVQTPPICFNYLGQFDQMINEEYGVIKELTFFGPRKYQEVARSYLLEINAYIQNGKLNICWNYSKALYRSNSIARFANYLADACRSLVQIQKNKAKFQSKKRKADISRVFSKINERKGR